MATTSMFVKDAAGKGRADANEGQGSTEVPRRTVSRRRVLGGLAAGSVVSLAGCFGGITDAGKRPFADNPVAEGVDERPRRGRPRRDTSITLVAFDDPSCPACSDLHEGAFRRIESEWLGTGTATAYSRMRPTVAEWGRPARNGLLETYRQAPEAYPELKRAYHDHQEELTEDNVVAKTEAFLADLDQSVDPAAVVQAVRDRPYAEQIDADAAVAEDVGVNGVPTVFVFRDGEFVTTLGDEDFAAYRSAVESHA